MKIKLFVIVVIFDDHFIDNFNTTREITHSKNETILTHASQNILIKWLRQQ